jgi:hypothetical protein
VPERAVNRGHQRPARRPENDPPHGARPGRSAPAAKRSPKQSAVLNLIVSAESAASRPSRTRSLRKLYATATTRRMAAIEEADGGAGHGNGVALTTVRRAIGGPLTR